MHKGIGPEIKKLLVDGKSFLFIKRKIGCSISTVSYHAGRMGLKRGKTPKKHDYEKIFSYYNEGHSFDECAKKFNVNNGLLWKASKRLGVNVRPQHSGMSAEKYMERHNGKKHARGAIRAKILSENLIAYSCAICSIKKWNNKDLTLRLDHINGKNSDHRLKNLRFLCPNCDSQLDTYCYRNRKE